jgi:hypothetical protein
MSCTRTLTTLSLFAGLCLPTRALAHPGSGIVVDRLGQVYFVDMVSGIWKLDTHGGLTHLPGPAFHFMTLDQDGRFDSASLPRGSNWEFARIGSDPSLLLASDFPLALGPGEKLYFPTQGRSPVRLQSFTRSGETTVVATLPATAASGTPLQWINGLAVGSDGSLYFSEDNAVRRAGPDGRVTTLLQYRAPSGCRGHNPLLRGLDVAADGTLFVADTGCGDVLEISPAGKVTVLPQVKSPWFPTGVARSGGDLYVLEFQNAETDDRRAMIPRLRKIAGDGTTTVIATVKR